MVTNFEHETQELNNYEFFTVLPYVEKWLEGATITRKILSSNKIITSLKAVGHKIDPARLRKIIHNIRVIGKVKNLVADSRGYYVTNDQEVLLKYIQSLQERTDSIQEVREAMMEQYKE